MRLKRQELDEIYFSKEYVRIDYKTSYSHGYYIVKSILYHQYAKKWKRVLKDCVCVETFPYKVTMLDIVKSAINKIEYKNAILISKLNSLHIRASKWTYYSYDSEIKEIEDKIDRNLKMLNRLKRKEDE